MNWETCAEKAPALASQLIAFKNQPTDRFQGTLEFDTTVKLGNKERFDKEQIGVKEPFPVTNCQFTS
jgi:hypothetical protein